MGDRWTALHFDDGDWATGPLGFGHGRAGIQPFLQTTVEPREVIEGSTTFLARIDFEVNDLASAQRRELAARNT